MTPLIATALMLSAQAGSAEANWRACVDRTTTNTDWAQCGGRYVRETDAALNAEWKRLMAASSGETKADLLAEQRAWIAYREKACAFQANGAWGREGQVLHYYGCVARVIRQRTEELAAYRRFAGGRRAP